MAFSLDNFDKLSQEGLTTVPKIWGYRSASDNTATIEAANYFDSVIDKLAVGDMIVVNASDANHLLMVTSVTTHVTTAALV